ncbi:MAG: hypothetical protein JOZ04_09045 [Acidimicrobiia bacterium]|nr:hypothetical protein [Acidimicrobiia bacterium]
MRITVDLDEAELAHMLEALGAVVDVVERRTDELVAAVIIRGVITKSLRAIEKAR